jgi:hypothetical protein
MKTANWRGAFVSHCRSACVLIARLHLYPPRPPEGREHPAGDHGLQQTRHHFRKLLGQVCQDCLNILLLQFLNPFAYQISFAKSLHEIIKRSQAFSDYRHLLFRAIPGFHKIKEGDCIRPILFSCASVRTSFHCI